MTRLLHRTALLYGMVLAVGCGGATSSSSAGDGAGGTGAESGGTDATNTTNSTSAVTTGGGCDLSMCGGSPCPDGRLVTPAGQCCPVCTCDQVECEPLDCPSGNTLLAPGACCAQCADTRTGCEAASCAGPSECGNAERYERPDGACCSGCMPEEPGNVVCLDIACPTANGCTPGYTRGDFVGGCCYQCLPDPLYCEDDSDCVRADRPRDCCGCPEVISKRTLDDDACWYAVDDPRPIPEACYPGAYCDAVCGACPDPGAVTCFDNRCVEVPLP